MSKSKYSSTIYFLLFYAILIVGVSWFASNIVFLLAGLVYIALVFWASIAIDKEQKTHFVKIVSFFLLFYSVYVVVLQIIFIEDPFNDYFWARDQLHFYESAVVLADLSIIQIWSVSFSDFQYSGSPLFYAYIASLQKITGMGGSIGLLFQNLNVSFIGSFVPGVAYLLCCRITNYQRAFKAAIVYGFFSFAFIYSVILLRDIHMALIYCVGLFIITGNKYNIRNYLLLFILGIIAYYIRMENGLFFLAFLGVWLYKSGSNRKLLIVAGSAVSIAGILFVLGGVDMIYKMALKTIQNYSKKSIVQADQSSLGLRLLTLPVPLNYIGATAFGQISPFPFWVVFKNGLLDMKNVFYLPQAIAGLFWFSVWMRIIRYPRKALNFYNKYKLVSITVILYLILVSMGVPGPRRLMTVYPIIYMCFIYISDYPFRAKELLLDALLYGLLLVIYFFLKV